MYFLSEFRLWRRAKGVCVQLIGETRKYTSLLGLVSLTLATASTRAQAVHFPFDVRSTCLGHNAHIMCCVGARTGVIEATMPAEHQHVRRNARGRPEAQAQQYGGAGYRLGQPFESSNFLGERKK